MELDVPLIQQAKGSWDCGPACIAMMLQYYGIDASIESLKEEIEMYDGKWKGSFMPQLGIPFLKRGFSVEIVLVDPRFFQFKKYNQDSIREQLEKDYKKEDAKELAKLMRAFMDEGGVFKVEVPSQKHIVESLEDEQPICALLTSRLFAADSPGFNQHFVVIKGLKNGKVIVNDPACDTGYHGGEQQYDVNHLLYGVHACAAVGLDSGSFLIVRKQ